MRTKPQRRFRLLIASTLAALSLAVVLTTLCCVSDIRAARSRGSNTEAHFLPITEWGFGEGSTVQVALARLVPYGKPEKAWDTRRKWGVIEIIERRWIPAGAPIPP